MASALVLTAVACGGILGPGGNCERALGLEACMSALEAAPNTEVSVTIENGTSGPVRLDTCSIQLIGRPDPAQPFEPVYDPTRRCDPDVTHGEILAASLPIAPGERLDMDLRIPAGLFQGQYRFHFWFLDDEGALLFAEPLPSRVFDVFPSAG